MKPYYEADGITIYHGDCREILPTLGTFDLCLTDPPYGIERFAKGFGKSRFRGTGVETRGIEWDKKPDKETLDALISCAKQSIIWGMNNLQLPTTERFLVWDKEQTVDNFASAELAWCNLRTPAKVFRYSIHEHNRTKSKLGHPTEKPIKAMTWCIGLADNPQSIIDPFMGSGTTLVAAKQLGRQATGIELEERYCEVAAKRLSQRVLPLFG